MFVAGLAGSCCVLLRSVLTGAQGVSSGTEEEANGDKHTHAHTNTHTWCHAWVISTLVTLRIDRGNKDLARTHTHTYTDHLSPTHTEVIRAWLTYKLSHTHTHTHTLNELHHPARCLCSLSHAQHPASQANDQLTNWPADSLHLHQHLYRTICPHQDALIQLSHFFPSTAPLTHTRWVIISAISPGVWLTLLFGCPDLEVEVVVKGALLPVTQLLGHGVSCTSGVNVRREWESERMKAMLMVAGAKLKPCALVVRNFVTTNYIWESGSTAGHWGGGIPFSPDWQ